MILLVFLILLQHGCATVEVKQKKISDICHMREVDFWKFFYWVFKNCDHLYLETFETAQTTNIIQEYLNELLLQLTIHKLYKKSFEISRNIRESNGETNIINTVEEAFNNFVCENPPEEPNATLDEVLEIVSEEKPGNETYLQSKIRSFSVEINYRHILIVHNEEYLLSFLENNWTKVFPKPRGIFALVFVSTEALSQNAIEKLFTKIWGKYQVLNMVIQQPCTCIYKDLFTFDPYYPKPNGWGLVKKFHIEEAIDNSSAYRRAMNKLNWYPLRISMFSRLPTAVLHFPSYLKENPIYKNLSLSLGFTGVDGMVLKTICERLMLKPINRSEEDDYGYESNGKYYSNLGEVADRSLDASFNSRYVEGVGLDVIEYLTPVLNDKFCIIVPKALEVPHYLMIFHCFTWKAWAIIAVTYFSSSVYWFVVRPIVIDLSTKKLKSSLSLSFMEVFGLFISISIPIRLVTSSNHRIFFVACMIFNIIIIGTFQGTLVTSFSTTTHYPDIDTLEQFDQSGLYVLTATRGVQTVFGDDGSEFFRNLNGKVKIVPKLKNAFMKIAYERNMASLDRRADAVLKIQMNYTSEDNVELIHIVKECPRSYHFTYIMPRGSPYVHVFNIIITFLREAGLLLKWNADIVEALVSQVRRKQNVANDKARGFTLNDMKIAFYILLSGYFLATLIFIMENVTRRCFKRFNKRRRNARRGKYFSNKVCY